MRAISPGMCVYFIHISRIHIYIHIYSSNFMVHLVVKVGDCHNEVPALVFWAVGGKIPAISGTQGLTSSRAEGTW